MKSYIKTVNPNSTAVLAGGIVPIGTIPATGHNRSNIVLMGDSIVIKDCFANGYIVTVNATFTAPVAGEVTLQVYQNGMAVSGATASETVDTATTEIHNIAFSTIVRSTAGCVDDVITLVNTGVASTFTNIEFDIVKL